MIHAVLTGDFSHALETLLAVSMLIVVVLMVRRTVSRQFGAGIVYLLWAIPVARFFLPPMTTPVSFLNLDIGALFPAAAPQAAITASETTTTTVTVDGALAAAASAPAPIAPTAGMDMVPVDVSLYPGDLLSLALMTGAAVWVAGAVYFAARSLITHYQFMKTVEREAMPVSARMADVAADLAAETGLRRPPRVVASLISRGPFVTGLLRPVVVMPAWFEDDYTPSEARAALAHEMMHVRRGDLWALQASELFVAALWFNPLAYIARNAFRTDQEAACDADVLSRCRTSPHAYGSTLVKAARLHLPEPVLAAARLPLTHALKERLTRMSYPAPSARRRMIGFGAALLFGVSTLAITSSVAAAGEPDESGASETHEFRFETNGLWIDGSDDDRQIVLLGDPMAKVMPPPGLPPEVEDLEKQIEIDAKLMSSPEMMGSILEWQSSDDWKEFEELSIEMANLAGEMVEHTVEDDGKTVTVRVRTSGGEMTEEEREALMAKLEAKGAALEAKMAAREAEMDAHEAKIESKMIVIERRMEHNGAEIERIMDEHFGDGFEAKVEAQAEVIEYLVDTCQDAELAPGETRIIERADADGDMVRLACVEGDRARLKAAETLAAVENFPGITAAEKAAFKAAAEGQKRKHVIVFRSDDSEMPEPPAPSEPPEAPETPEPPLKGG